MRCKLRWCRCCPTKFSYHWQHKSEHACCIYGFAPNIGINISIRNTWNIMKQLLGHAAMLPWPWTSRKFTPGVLQMASKDIILEAFQMQWNAARCWKYLNVSIAWIFPYSAFKHELGCIQIDSNNRKLPQRFPLRTSWRHVCLPHLNLPLELSIIRPASYAYRI